MANLFQDVLFDESKTRALVEQYGSPMLLLDCEKLADQYRQLFEFPCLELDEWSVKIAGPNQMKPVAKFTAKQAASSPNGMPFIRPFRLTRWMVNSVVAF